LSWSICRAISASTARVAREHEPADLLAQLRIDLLSGGLGARQTGQFGLDVQRRLATSCAPGVACLEHLADLVVALRGGLEGGAGQAPWIPAVGVLEQGIGAIAVPAAAAEQQRDHRAGHADDGDRDHDDQERLVHAPSLPHRSDPVRGWTNVSVAARQVPGILWFQSLTDQSIDT
jgi:hypothetical protein